MGTDAITLSTPVSMFDRIVQGAGSLAGTVSNGVTKSLSRSKAEELHIALPEVLEAEIIDFHRLLIKEFKKAGIEDSMQKLNNVSDLQAAMPTMIQSMPKIKEVMESQIIKDSLQVIKEHIDKLKTKYGGTIPHKIEQLITTIRPPELINMNFGFWGAYTTVMVLIAGYCMGELTKQAPRPPSPPPPPPAPRR